MAPIPATGLRKNVFHVWPDPPGRRLAMYFATVDCATSIPSKQLAMNTRRASQWVLHAHPPYQAANLDRDLGSTAMRA
jgi:hypothetical protein